MKTLVQPVALKPEACATSERHVVKTVALFTFRGLRSLIDAAKEVPDIVSQAANDISEAWEESSRPKS